MYRVQRIYDFHTLPPHTAAVFVDRLYPRGIEKARMAGVLWLKELTPSAALRKWYHQDTAANFAVFSSRYLEELHGETQQQALGRLKALAAQQDVWLLTAVKQPQQSHVSVLLADLGEPFVWVD